MGVSNKTIMKKMMTELEQATDVADEPKKWNAHIVHVKLLSELLLQEHGSDQLEEKPAHDHLHTPSTSISRPTDSTTQDDGTSIFDF